MSSPRILIVDDSRTVRVRVRQLLEGTGIYQVLEASDGGEALQLLEKNPIDHLPDLILLDRNMPHVSGDACIRILKSDAVWRNIPVIFLTAQADKAEVAKGLTLLGCNDYLPKPFDSGEMLARVNTQVRIKQAEDENRILTRNLEVAFAEQQKAYAELRQSEEKIRLLMESVGEGVIGLDRFGTITFANPQAILLLGRSLSDMLGQNAQQLFHYNNSHGNPVTAETCLWRTTLTSGVAIHTEDEVFWRGDGSWMEVECRATAARQGEELVGAVISFSDITERKRIQRERDEALEVISSSIRYASRIQHAILPELKLFETRFNDYFVLWEPRDVVSGDIYWCDTWGEGTLLILGDCTGHGVPGAFMTLIAGGALGRAKGDIPHGDVAALMQRMHQIIQITLGQNTDTGGSDDGIELGLCFIHGDGQNLTFAGARFDLLVVEEGKVTEIKGNKKGIGYRGVVANQTYDSQMVTIQPSSRYYMTTDGLIDQIGGTSRRAFGKNRFKELLLSVQNLPMPEQRVQIYSALLAYQGGERRRDDVSVIGFQPARLVEA
ncbi:MAG: response regulator [Magnetococcales bacterium]|nr:response regulator [Magnetococcales bacterium]NGZ27454.1 response regulator [Magnetococcales bacterium]